MNRRLVDAHDISWILCVFAAGSAALAALVGLLLALLAGIVPHPIVTIARDGSLVLGGLWFLISTTLLAMFCVFRYRLAERGLL